MADIAFNHGTRVSEDNSNVVPIRTKQSAVIFLQGTDENADPAVFPEHTPQLIYGGSNISLAKSLSNDSELKEGLDAIMDQSARYRLGAYVYLNRVPKGVDANETLSNMVGDATSLTGIHAAMKCESMFGRNLKPRIFCAPGHTHALATAGVASANITEQGDSYPEEPLVTITPESGNTPTVHAVARAVLGTGSNAGKVVAIVFDRHGEGYTNAGAGPTIDIAAPPSGTKATATLTIGTVGNPLAHEMEGVCDKLRAVSFIDGQNTTDAAAVLARQKYGSERLYMVDPFVQVWDTELDGYVSQPASARFAGVQSRVDREIGFHKSVSNELIYGIDGPSRPISYGNQSNYLNENAVGTIISFGEGYRTWGNRNTANTFLAVRRTKDFINEAIEEAFLKFVDKPMNDANIKFLVESGRAFLRTLEAEQYLLKGSSDVWLDPDLNEPTEMKQGRITLSIKFEPPPPMEDIRVIAHPNIQAYTLLLDRVRGAIEAGPLAIANA